ncbi:ABC transporter ATP-binding protein [Streptomyces melanogenes]|uniref:ABC transporter ATP-binding protein n=1 Tax=Streptomyces melanogenes TaxID=67326 RepID=UPI00167F016B|nr:ATP-binding cassette domain-containing protein [Streptomyces melanogenes]GGP87843.1 ABC transporter ATP-binding protein [Streptomyces melanogenes]
MTSPDILVGCHGVARTYGVGAAAVVAVHGATCEVRSGDRIAITGPSGSGKSTLLHLMAALEEPTTGRVTWPGLARGPVPDQVGVVFQGPSLIPALDVVENTALPLVLAGHREEPARRRALDCLALVIATGLADKLPEELSGGQAQRVAVARALAAAPRLILADEPTGQLDRATGRHVVDVLLATADTLGAALVLTTHDPTVARRLTLQWSMDNGRLRTEPQPPRQPAAAGPHEATP